MKRTLAGMLFILLCAVVGSAIELKFNDEAGRKYRFKNLIVQDIYYDGHLVDMQSAMNKAILEVVDVSNDYAKIEGEFDYYTKTRNINEPYHLLGIYDSEFMRNELGEMIIDDIYYLPTVRDIPTFPGYDLEIGETWHGVGYERHEPLMEGFGEMEFEVEVDYKLVEITTNVSNHVIVKLNIDYHVMYFPAGDPDIRSFTGYDHMTYYWDHTVGAPDSYNDVYSFMMNLKSGHSIMYTGTSSARMEMLNDLTNKDLKELTGVISNSLKDDDGVKVSQLDDGILVNLGNILFDINRATLKDEALDTLDKLAEIMRDYPGLDIEVSGHTDNTGTEEYNLALSEERAKSVSDYLMEQGIDPTRISYAGYGWDVPVASNDTSDGRALNRRVEIKIITVE